MALKKGFCTNCKGEEQSRIFDVNQEANKCFCPNCMAEMSPKQAIANYNALISSLLKKGSKYIFKTTQYHLAYQTFAHVIDINNTIKAAYFGRIYSLLCLSTLRKSKITLACSLHKNEANKLFHYQETINEYYHFLKLLLSALDTYENRMKKRILNHGIFYDPDCVVLYLTRIDEIKNYKQFIASEAQYFVDNNKNQFKKIVDLVNRDLPRYQDVYSETFPILDGSNYVFNKYSNPSSPLITLQREKHNYKRKISRSASLYPRNNNRKLIKDEIFRDKYHLTILVEISIPLAIFLFIIGMVGIVIAYVNEATLFNKSLLFIISMGVIAISITLFVFRFVWKKKLIERYYSGINPFILK
ncbi:MAG TPA: hypothetical protein GX010_03420 [Erysipelotrichaceae bacterium]|nr:hypothetical protein [Erysipelotrichaceae bacterium]